MDATIVRMRTDGDSFTKIALKLGNGLSTNDIKNRWNRVSQKIKSVDLSVC